MFTPYDEEIFPQIMHMLYCFDLNGLLRLYLGFLLIEYLVDKVHFPNEDEAKRANFRNFNFELHNVNLINGHIMGQMKPEFGDCKQNISYIIHRMKSLYIRHLTEEEFAAMEAKAIKELNLEKQNQPLIVTTHTQPPEPNKPVHMEGHPQHSSPPTRKTLSPKVKIETPIQIPNHSRSRKPGGKISSTHSRKTRLHRKKRPYTPPKRRTAHEMTARNIMLIQARKNKKVNQLHGIAAQPVQTNTAVGGESRVGPDRASDYLRQYNQRSAAAPNPVRKFLGGFIWPTADKRSAKPNASNANNIELTETTKHQ